MDTATWAVLLLLLGFTLLVLEFFIPSGGSLAVMCALSLLAAIVVGFMAGRVTGSVILLTEVVLVPAALAAAVNWWPETPIGRMMLIQKPESPDDVLPETHAYRGLKELIGRRGIAKGLMLPSGQVEIDGRSYDAVGEGVAIDPGQLVVVVAISTQRLVVRPDTTLRAELVNDSAAIPLEAGSQSRDPLAQQLPDPFADDDKAA